ncbi:MAG: hypothetical protein ABI847_10450, partial [Anaerolineales bacterium]
MDDPLGPPALPTGVQPNPTGPALTAGGDFVQADKIVTQTAGGDIVGRDKITTGYTPEQVAELYVQLRREYQPKPFDGRCPYIGLEAFDEHNAEWFFGREAEVGDLLARVRLARAVFIAGPSGSGKSSLARAGLLVALKQGRLPGSEHWLYQAFTPGRSPLEALARAVAGLAQSLGAGEDLLTKGTTDPALLHRWADVALGDNPHRRAVLLVDQFEELFTPMVREPERLAFIQLLVQAINAEHGRVIVFFTLRSDFVAACAAYPALNALLSRQFLQVGELEPDNLVRAIALPALRAGLPLDPDLISQVVNDMRDEPAGALPLMQFALKDLFDMQQQAGGISALTRAGYIEHGGLAKALQRHADAELAKLSALEQQLARDIFAKLIQPGRGTQDTRRTALLSEVEQAEADPVAVATIVHKLADARLITTGGADKAGDEAPVEATLTLAHEKLIDAWPWLKKLVNDNREVIALQNEIAEDARQWDEHKCDTSYLYTGARLATAREQLAAKKLALPERAQVFVQAAIEAEEADRRTELATHERELAQERQATDRLRVRNRVIGVFAVAVVAALLVAVLFAIQANTNLHEAENNAGTATVAQGQALVQAAIATSAQGVAQDQAATAVAAQSTAQANQAEAERQSQLSLAREMARLSTDLLTQDAER